MTSKLKTIGLWIVQALMALVMVGPGLAGNVTCAAAGASAASSCSFV